MTTLATVQPVRWEGDRNGHLILIDQTLLPGEFRELRCKDVATIWEAIRSLRVRGAPAIGIAAAYGVVVALQASASGPIDAFYGRLDEATDFLAQSRPTAVNLFWALERMRRKAESLRPQAGASRETAAQIHAALLVEAQAIHDEDREMCHAIGRHGAELLGHGQSVLTHCNAGGLATAEYGTALAVFFTAQDQGKGLHVFVDETRPLLQGARLTAWELVRRGIPATLICDSMAAQVMREGRVQAVVTGADRIAANGDTANKIGTYGLAVLARAHGIPFYVAAPTSSFDLGISSGAEIPIEQRPGTEVTQIAGRTLAPEGVQVYNPAFDVTPAELIAAIITERGLIRPVTRPNVESLVGGRAYGSVKGEG